MKLHLKYAGAGALSMALVFSALSMQGQTAQSPSGDPNQSAQPTAVPAGSAQNPQTGAASTGTSQAQGESLADRARRAKAANRQTQSAAKPKNFNQDNLSAATSKKTYSKTSKRKRNGLRKTS